ncbi:crossover junction endodeoxyribonuclease RuvC [Patescibacteria group bacterium]|nr:crossover junction endodeoxyribonuclease RuvC [Patescibacteria group bacterium]
MRIIGIDPGIARTGWGIIEKNNNSSVKAVKFGCFQTQAKEQIPNRLKYIFSFLTQLIEEYRPDSLAIEELFFNTNAKTALIVGQARGVVILTAALKGIPVSIYTPLQVKIAITGYGRAEKSQIGQMVKVLLKLSSIPAPDDTADALAIALTHAFTVREHK